MKGSTVEGFDDHVVVAIVGQGRRAEPSNNTEEESSPDNNAKNNLVAPIEVEEAPSLVGGAALFIFRSVVAKGKFSCIVEALSVVLLVVRW